MSLVPLSQAGPTPLALRSCVPPVVANDFLLPSLSLRHALFSFLPGPDLDKAQECRGKKRNLGEWVALSVIS